MSRYNNITVFDMTQLPFNYRKELFFDKGHLNSDGAQQFSLIIADSLQVHLN
jgi:lysophospholipase L1-like esterase